MSKLNATQLMINKSRETREFLKENQSRRKKFKGARRKRVNIGVERDDEDEDANHSTTATKEVPSMNSPLNTESSPLPSSNQAPPSPPKVETPRFPFPTSLLFKPYSFKPLKTLNLIGQYVTERDASVRTASLDCLAEAYGSRGPKQFWKYLSKMPDKEKDTVDCRLRRISSLR